MDAEDPNFVVGGAVSADLLLASTPTTAVLVRHISATPRGLFFSLLLRLNDRVERDGEPVEAWRLWEKLLYSEGAPDDEDPKFHVEFSDGREFWPPTKAAMRRGDVTLQHNGSSGTDDSFDIVYWLEALPPPGGDVTFVIGWSSRGVDEGRVAVSADEVLQPARRAVPLFQP
jgi:hypothetical protein